VGQAVPRGICPDTMQIFWLFFKAFCGFNDAPFNMFWSSNVEKYVFDIPILCNVQL
jgi:hypothetical protein